MSLARGRRALAVAAVAVPALAGALPVEAGCAIGEFCIDPAAAFDPGPTAQILLSPGPTSPPGNLDLNAIDGSAIDGSTAIILQSGSANSAYSTTIDSPGSFVVQKQVGNFNASNVLIAGGALNRVSVEQYGNGFTSDVYLLKSTGTTVNTSQAAGNAAISQLIVLYGKPGTVINAN